MEDESMVHLPTARDYVANGPYIRVAIWIKLILLVVNGASKQSVNNYYYRNDI